MDRAIRRVRRIGISEEDMMDFQKSNELIISDPKCTEPLLDQNADSFCDGKSESEVTLKFMYGESDTPEPEHVDQALKVLAYKLNAKFFDIVLISWNQKTSLDEKSEKKWIENFLKFWRALEKLVECGIISRIGVCDLTTRQLEKFIPLCSIKPSFDQINFTFKNCCQSNSHDLLEYSKKEGFELLTHGDDDIDSVDFQILWKKLLKSHGIISDSQIFPGSSEIDDENLADDSQSIRSSELNSTGHDFAQQHCFPPKSLVCTEENALNPRWILKYSVSLRCRGIASNKG